MLEFEELNQRLMQSEKPIENLKEALDIDNLVKEVAELEEQCSGFLGRYATEPKDYAENRLSKGKDCIIRKP